MREGNDSLSSHSFSDLADEVGICAAAAADIADKLQNGRGSVGKLLGRLVSRQLPGDRHAGGR